MTHNIPKKTVRRGRVFPEIQWSPAEKAKRKAEDEAFYQRCRLIFEQVCPDWIKNHYGWYIAVEPDTGDYFIDADKEKARQKAHQKYPDAVTCMFCFNETGSCGKI